MEKEIVPSKKPALNLPGDKSPKLSQQGTVCENSRPDRLMTGGPRVLDIDVSSRGHPA